MKKTSFHSNNVDRETRACAELGLLVHCEGNNFTVIGDGAYAYFSEELIFFK